MEVTSIRLEASLKEQLKVLAGSGKGYQALIRDILWQYVRAATEAPTLETIRSLTPTTALRDEQCTLTGKAIPKGAQAWLALADDGTLFLLAQSAVKP